MIAEILCFLRHRGHWKTIDRRYAEETTCTLCGRLVSYKLKTHESHLV